MSAVFITATGTDIGKTFVAAGLIRHWRAVGGGADALKPVVTGFHPDRAASSDPGVLLEALGRPINAAEIECISPWRFAEPLSPDMAARQERREIDFEALVAYSRKALATMTSPTLIEGIGGVMVPLDDRHTVLDWIAALNIPVLIVTGSYLGSLSHTLTSLDALKRRDVPVKALVINETLGSTVSLTDTVATLSRFAAPIPIVTLPRVAAEASAHPAFSQIAELL